MSHQVDDVISHASEEFRLEQLWWRRWVIIYDLIIRDESSDEWQWVTTFSNFRSVLPVSRLCIGLSGEVTEVHVTSSSVWRHRLQWWVNRWVIMSHNVGESYSETLWRHPTKKVKMGKTYVWRFFSKFSLASLLRVHRTLEYFKIKGTKGPTNGF